MKFRVRRIGEEIPPDLRMILYSMPRRSNPINTAMLITGMMLLADFAKAFW
jgi:hypothetical protein